MDTTVAMGVLTRPIDGHPPSLDVARVRSAGLDPADGDAGSIARARQEDVEAFSSLVRGSARLLWADTYPRTRDRHRTEDVLQETYLIAWRTLGRFQDTGDPAAFNRWLLTIARSVQVDDVRARTRRKRGGGRPPVDLAAVERQTIEPAAGPDQSAVDREQSQRLLDRLDQLPEVYRQPIAMRYLSGADYETVRRQLSLTDGSLRGLLHRGLAQLRKLMTD